MHACICLARNYFEVLSHCGHGHDLTSVAKLSLVNIADLRSAFVETLASKCILEPKAARVDWKGCLCPGCMFKMMLVILEMMAIIRWS